MTDNQDAPLVDLAPKRWLCCCGGTGVDSHGQTCEHCEGLGFT
ncbi:hypothetical protein OG884_11995 [Streptosporangium sp. NBC_01755]|nr:hypothetical protein [Streptosporangium sp. NBC_01755]WSD02584.1 hypothetical protein OG884_11995 [Streptosporangium sp. NBC_01755]